MELQLITYRGRAVAACTPRRVFFSGDIEARDPEDPVKRFVREMCMYAGTLLNGLAPGPYSNADARAHARRVLMPAELLEDPIDAIMLDEERLAQDIGSPVNGAAKRALAGPLHIYRRAKRTVDRGEPLPEEQFADDAPSGAAFALTRGTQQLRRVLRSGHENTAEGSVRVSDCGPGTRF